jgi:general secretion pathway protein G
MKQYFKRQGFTLIELLVVMGIIALLAAIVFPAIGSALKRGKTATAQTEIKSIENALNGYFTDYGRFPRYSGDRDVVLGETARPNNQIIPALRGLDNERNPRRINYLEVAEKSLDADGNMVDPWGVQYKIALNTDFDQMLNAGITNLPGRKIAVWSDGSGELIRSW